jgi:hypothetical protein
MGLFSRRDEPHPLDAAGVVHPDVVWPYSDPPVRLQTESITTGQVSPDAIEDADPPYPPFSGDDARCVKCGGWDVSMRYLAGREFSDRIGGPVRVYREAMVRECDNCGYTWREQCADASADDG